MLYLLIKAEAWINDDYFQLNSEMEKNLSQFQDLLEALHSLGISPTEQEVVDMQCEVEKKGRIFFPDFCKLCLRKFREFDEENFRQELFKVSRYDRKWVDPVVVLSRCPNYIPYESYLLISPYLDGCIS